MFCCIYLGSEKCSGGGGGATEIFEINLLRTWDVDTKGRISQKYYACAPLFWLFLEGKGVVCPMHG